MKSFIFMIPAILLFACGSNDSEEENSTPEIADEETISEEVLINTEADSDMLYILRDGSAGLFEIGIIRETVEELALEYGNVEIAKIDLMTEGMPAPALQLTFNNSEAIILHSDEGYSSIYAIEVYSNLFATQDGIGVGSTYDDLENNYSFGGVARSDEGEPLVIVREAGMSFVIEPGDWWKRGDVVGEVPGDAKVTAIFLW
ncbi:MAG: hypothetical protein K8S62_14515 [Candidatus Sabulitectum sp.]|nr:hypothetical protein [Candidatus Sabulitectum sp.]